MSADTAAVSAWKLERQISIAVLVTILLQSAAALLWAGSAAERIDQLERRAAGQDAVNERLARLEEKMSQAGDSLTRIERRLEVSAHD